MTLTRVKDITNIIEEFFPLSLAEDWDNSGLQVGSYDNEVKKVVVALDIDEFVVKSAIEAKAELIITHHPMFFKGIKKINYSTSQGKLIKSLITNDITVYSAHTNLDAGENGLNQLLATTLELEDIRPLYKGKEDTLFKLVVYVPTTHIEEVRRAINEAGSGNIGNYSDCSFRTLGTGTFKPGEDTNPFIGETGQLEEVEEYRLETVVYKSNIHKVLKAMHDAHPYEEVAYDLYELKNEGQYFSMGRVGMLSNKMSLKEFAQLVKTKLNLDHLRVVGDLSKPIKKVAVIGGSGASLINKVVSQNVDVLVTGDLKYHEAKDAQSLGLSVIDAGHQGTEEIMVNWLANWMSSETKARNMEVVFTPIFANKCFTFL
ncbi:MAG: Nif3-like dinuclear metal center hexameric protein [Syntrophomonadaceae bacterium]|nr:Nif3-like dinuclear metal center hexameric protein [Syntrophomonadaceae bacterium]